MAKTQAAKSAADVGSGTKPGGTGARFRHGDDDVFVMGTDAHGNLYDGRTNNPKRAGSMAHKRFSVMRDGMTIGEYVEALGGDAGARRAMIADVNYGEKKGLFSVKKAEA